jgi:thiol:disulfide interchange protein
MKKVPILIISLILVLGYVLLFRGGGKAAIPAGFDPAMTVDSAHSAAQADGKPILVFLTASWCGPCQSFKRGTLSTQSVTQALQTKVHAVYLDIDQASQKARQMNVSGVPTLILYNKDGKEIRRQIGGLSEQDMLAFLTP